MNEPLDNQHGLGTAHGVPALAGVVLHFESASNHFDIQGQAHVVPAKAGTPYAVLEC